MTRKFQFKEELLFKEELSLAIVNASTLDIKRSDV